MRGCRGLVSGGDIVGVERWLDGEVFGRWDG